VVLKRLFDLVFSISALIIFAPLFLLVGISIKIASPGPILFKAIRAGKNGKPFSLLKFRTMHQGSESGSAITAICDQRVFGFGSFLRKTKIDELPQFFNVLTGDMSVVGPRPEAQDIVTYYYDELGYQTLSVRPGIASPGSLFNYTHAHQYLKDDPEMDYVYKFLPIKLAIEKVYIDNADFWQDLQVIYRTFHTIVQIAMGKVNFPYPSEYLIAMDQGLIDKNLMK